LGFAKRFFPTRSLFFFGMISSTARACGSKPTLLVLYYASHDPSRVLFTSIGFINETLLAESVNPASPLLEGSRAAFRTIHLFQVAIPSDNSLTLC
jgi:hypothetical protein